MGGLDQAEVRFGGQANGYCCQDDLTIDSSEPMHPLLAVERVERRAVDLHIRVPTAGG